MEISLFYINRFGGSMSLTEVESRDSIEVSRKYTFDNYIVAAIHSFEINLRPTQGYLTPFC